MHVIWLLKGKYNLPLLFTDVVNFQFRYETSTSLFARRIPSDLSARNNILGVPRSTGSSSSNGSTQDSEASPKQEKAFTRNYYG